MDTIRINRMTLLDILNANRAAHEQDFHTAHAKWTQEATKALKEAAQKAEAGGEITVQPLADLPKPQSYLKSYDDAIARVELDTRDELNLDDREFSAFVQDDWNWRGAFAATTSFYNGN